MHNPIFLVVFFIIAHYISVGFLGWSWLYRLFFHGFRWIIPMSGSPLWSPLRPRARRWKSHEEPSVWSSSGNPWRRGSVQPAGLSWVESMIIFGMYMYMCIYIYTHLFIYSFFTYRVFPVSSSWMSPLWLLGLLSDHDRAYLESRFWALTSDMFKSSNHRRDLIETEMRAEQLPSTAKKTWIGSATWTLALQWR